MITQVEIDGLRGINAGKVDGLSSITFLVGRNGTGKSTVLDALLVGCAVDLGDAVGRAVRRRFDRIPLARWLFWRRQEQALIKVANASGVRRTTRLTWVLTPSMDSAEQLDRRGKTYSSSIDAAAYTPNGGGPDTVATEFGSKLASATVAFATDNTFYRRRGEFHPTEMYKLCSEVRLVDVQNSSTSRNLSSLYTEAVDEGRWQSALGILKKPLPKLDHLENLPGDNGSTEHSLRLVFPDHAVPLALAGDGIVALARMSLELASRTKGLVLLEEPETHLHPGAIGWVAEAFVAAASAGLQLVIATHSLELIDRVLTLSEGAMLEKISIIRTLLDEGTLRTSRIGGEDAALMRKDLEQDLR